MILFVHISDTASSTVSLSGVVTNLNNKESNKMNLSTSVSTLCMALPLLGICFRPNIATDL